MTLSTNSEVPDAYRSQTTSIDARLLQCPNCQGRLEETMANLFCQLCGEEWPIVDGVPHFGGTDYRSHVLTVAQRRQIAQTAAAKGWKVALHDLLRSINPTVYRQAIDEYRAQWRFVAPLTANSRVLDLSCGWGAAAFNLAESSALVAAADASSAQARFVALRAQQTGQDNIISVQLGLDQRLPFATGYFDAVVLVDALSRVKDTELQRLVLRRIRAVLRPGGSLFLADINRLSAARLATWSIEGNPHTLGGYQRLLQSAGFRDLRVYSPAPSHLEPFFMIPLDRQKPLAYFLREIVGAQDFQFHLRQRGLGALVHLIRMVVRWTPADLAATLARPFVPSMAILAR